ncbi:HsdM family class I SAM-dependent methyltransferase [Sphaerisporangium corydalis]|uniref:Class I SAM-dependent DNA methyltransferase n=1 Tax=Sphaerisporangium corydalis TaxID=1441875 RepID=A0ABV9ENF9_9ACTN|nr:SAM-dependent methyltransferase [Sphaerisporangium corydalis]
MAEPSREPFTITLAETARMAGVGRAAVSNWRRRFDDFPKMNGGTDSSPVFSLDEIERWLLRHEKIKRATGGLKSLWPRIEALGDRDLIGAVIIAVGTELAGVEPPASSEVRNDPELRALVSQAVDLAGNEDISGFLEALFARFLKAFVRQIPATPAPLADLMTAIAALWHNSAVTSVLDPSCGTGNVLIAAQRSWPAAKLAGQDHDPLLGRIAELRLQLVGASDAVIFAADSLLTGSFQDEVFDVVLSVPPSNEREWGQAELATDARWVYGQPLRTEPELAWVQNAVSALAPGGVAVLLLPPAVATRRAGRSIRGALLRTGTLRAVISLPPGAAPPFGIALQLWVLCKTAQAAPVEDPLFIDGSGHRSLDSLGRTMIGWEGLSLQIAGARNNSPQQGSVRVPVIELLDEHVDLTPSRRIPASTSSAAMLSASWATFDTKLTEITKLGRELSRFRPSAAPEKPSFVTVAELERSGALEIITGRAVPEPLLRLGERGQGGVPVLLLSDLGADGGRWISREDALEHGGQLTASTMDDLIVVAMSKAFDLWVEDAAPVIFGPHFQLIRPDRSVIDPWFLAACLRAPDNVRQAGHRASSLSRVDVRRLRVLRLPFEQQRAQGEIYQKAVSLKGAIAALTAEGAHIQRAVEETITTGRLIVPPG